MPPASYFVSCDYTHYCAFQSLLGLDPQGQLFECSCRFSFFSGNHALSKIVSFFPFVGIKSFREEI